MPNIRPMCSPGESCNGNRQVACHLREKLALRLRTPDPSRHIPTILGEEWQALTARFMECVTESRSSHLAFMSDLSYMGLGM